MSPRPSQTYKIKAVDGSMDHAVYFTIADNWLFVNCKAMESFQFITALMTAYSRHLQAGGSVETLVADMKDTFDTTGGYDGGVKMPSLIHHLGLILESHCETL